MLCMSYTTDGKCFMCWLPVVVVVGSSLLPVWLCWCIPHFLFDGHFVALRQIESHMALACYKPWCWSQETYFPLRDYRFCSRIHNVVKESCINFGHSRRLVKGWAWEAHYYKQQAHNENYTTCMWQSQVEIRNSKCWVGLRCATYIDLSHLCCTYEPCP